MHMQLWPWPLRPAAAMKLYQLCEAGLCSRYRHTQLVMQGQMLKGKWGDEQ